MFNARMRERERVREKSEIREVSFDLLKLAAGRQADRQVDGTFISFPYYYINY